ncbi:MAG: hypothetical protein HY700_12085 [Gemmatimonadetes bacterium]|nr:hypothetical protein [Gemmatimonadota bacterium]
MRTNQTLRGLHPAAAILLAFFAGSCDWISLAQNALSYRTIQRGEAANLAAHGDLLYATLAEDGLAVVEASTGKTLATTPPPAGSESVDDIAIADRWLFALDARAPGHLSVFSLDDPLHPRLVSPPHEVPVGLFSGVSAGGGLCIVSGGTSDLTAWTYDSAGTLAGPVSTADLGRSQPEVLVTGDGTYAFVSTHYWGPYFGLDVLHHDAATHRLERLAELALKGAGFTQGGAKPANFPIEAAMLGKDTLLIANARGVAVSSVAGSHPALVLFEFGTAGVSQVTQPLPAGTFPTAASLLARVAAVAAGDRGVLVLHR